MKEILSVAIASICVNLFAVTDLQPARGINLFENVTSITLRHETLNGVCDKIVIEDQAEISKIVSAIVLKPKEPCACAHSYSAVFLTKGSTVKVSFCDHCFDIAEGERFVSYEMPPAIYVQFAKLLSSDVRKYKLLAVLILFVMSLAVISFMLIIKKQKAPTKPRNAP